MNSRRTSVRRTFLRGRKLSGQILRRFSIVVLIFLILAATLHGCGAGNHDRAWTVMIYLDGDNNLARAATVDLEEIRRATVDSNIEVVLQVDLRAPYVPATTQRYRLVNGAFERLADLGEADMAAPDTLTDFVRWAGQSFPAERTALILWNHGNGWDQGDTPRAKLGVRSILYDDDNGSSFLANADVRAAIERAGVKLDVLGLDASIMGTIEAMYEFRNLAPILISSQEVGHDSGWDYTRLLSGLTEDTDSEGFARSVVSTYRDFFEQAYYPADPTYEKKHTVTALRSACFAVAAAEVERVARSTLSELGEPSTRASALARLTNARIVAQSIDYYVQPSVYVDLADFLVRVDPASPIGQIIADCTVAEYHGAARPQAHGVSIVFYDPQPAKKINTFDINYRNWDASSRTGNRGEFINAFHWDELVSAYADAMAP